MLQRTFSNYQNRKGLKWLKNRLFNSDNHLKEPPNISQKNTAHHHRDKTSILDFAQNKLNLYLYNMTLNRGTGPLCGQGISFLQTRERLQRLTKLLKSDRQAIKIRMM